MVTSMKQLPKFSARSRLNVEPEESTLHQLGWWVFSAATSGYQWPRGYRPLHQLMQDVAIISSRCIPESTRVEAVNQLQKQIIWDKVFWLRVVQLVLTGLLDIRLHCQSWQYMKRHMTHDSYDTEIFPQGILTGSQLMGKECPWIPNSIHLKS